VAEPAPFDPAGGAEAGMPRRERGARAGRNLPLAILTALLLAGVLIASLVLSRPAFIAFLLGIVTLALLELLTVLRARATRPARPVVLAMGALLVVGAYLEGPVALSFGLLATVLAAFAWYLVDRGRTEVTRNVAATVFAVVYVPFMAAHLSLVVGRADHYVGALLGYAALVVIYDTAAYATGATLGRRPSSPPRCR
jgi:phosphatidate cytidylyltransferase